PDHKWQNWQSIYIEPLTELNGSHLVHCQDIAPDLETLKNRVYFIPLFFFDHDHQKVVVRLREFLLRQSNDLGVKQQYLLNFKVYVYVLQYGQLKKKKNSTPPPPEVGKEVCTFYCDLMSKSDLIGTEMDRTGSIFSSKKMREYLNPRVPISPIECTFLKEFKEITFGDAND
ncbi:hypothetical protein RFI_04079, partial [Reticulomyxa filosa]